MDPTPTLFKVFSISKCYNSEQSIYFLFASVMIFISNLLELVVNITEPMNQLLILVYLSLMLYKSNCCNCS